MVASSLLLPVLFLPREITATLMAGSRAAVVAVRLLLAACLGQLRCASSVPCPHPFPESQGWL